MPSNNEVRQQTRRRDYTNEIIGSNNPVDYHRGSKKNFKFHAIGSKRILIILLVVVCLAGSWLYLDKNSSPLPQSVIKSLSFTIYYPSKLPAGYALQSGSVSNSNGILIYIISGNGNQITIAEQAKPAKPPNLVALTKPQTVSAGPGGAPATLPAFFQTVDSPLGQAVQGTNSAGNPTAIVLTGTSLISISGSNSLPTSTLSTIVQNLQPTN